MISFNRTFLITLAKMSISLLLCYVVLQRVDLSNVLASLLNKQGLVWFAAAIFALFVQSVFGALRLRLIVDALGGRCRLVDGLVIWMSGLFVSQTMVTIVAGDLVRAYQLRQVGNPALLSGNSILLDRLVGVATLLLMSFLALPFLSTAVSDQAVGDIMVHIFTNILLISLGILILLFVLRTFVRSLIGSVTVLKTAKNFVARDLFTFGKVKIVGSVILVSALMHLCNVLSMFMFTRHFQVEIGFWPMACIVLPVTFIMLLPISFAGWGVREGSMVIGFGLLGVDAGLAVSVSVAFGMALLIASLPGALGLVVSRWKPAATHFTADTDQRENCNAG